MTRDEELMTALHDEHAAVLHAFVSRYTDDRQRVQDVVQETLLRAWKGIDSIDPTRDSTRSYLFTVARNVLTDLWRAEQRRPKLVSGAAAMAAVAAVPSPDDVDSAVEGWLVAAALETLTPEHRSVIQSLYFEGRSVADTARALTVPAGTVKSRAYYAVRALRAAFQESGVLR